MAKLSAVILLTWVMVWPASAAYSADSQPCDTEYQQTMSLSPDKQVSAWRKIKTPCRQSQRYYVVGASIAQQLLQFNDALAFINEGLKHDGEYRIALQYSLADLYLTIGHNADKALPIAERLVKDYPDFIGGYWKKAHALLQTGAIAEAISVLEGSPNAEGTAQTQASLAVAYGVAGKDLECARAMQRAIRLDREQLGNVYAVSAAAYALVRLGHLPEAQDLLVRHLAIRPESTDNEEYRNASRFVQAAMVKSEKP